MFDSVKETIGKMNLRELKKKIMSPPEETSLGSGFAQQTAELIKKRKKEQEKILDD